MLSCRSGRILRTALASSYFFAAGCLAPNRHDQPAVNEPSPDPSGGGDSGAPAMAAVDAPPLRDAAESVMRLIGVAYNTSHSADPDYDPAAAAQFDYVTPENEMKWNATEPAQGTFTFGGGDQVVAFAQGHGMKVKGHNLVWNKQLPPWVSALGDQASVQSAMVNHIIQVAGHFQGQVNAWDVVNEAWNDDGQTLKSDVFLTYLGPSYIDLAFQTARATDPNALLYYNDFGTEGLSDKANAVYNMVSSMKTRGIPIDGVGMQMHTQSSDGGPSVDEFTANMARLAALGLQIVVSEFDVQLCSGSLDDQGQRFHDIVAACVAQPACTAVTVWGVTDKYSWLNGQTCASPVPLLFDNSYDVKPAYTGVWNAFSGQ